MKIAISAQGRDLDSPVDPRFGRAAGFVVFDTESGAAEYFENTQNLNLPQGAGIQTAQNVAETGAKAVITGHVGPKAFLALDKGSIAVHLFGGGSVREALESFQAGTLEAASGPDKQGHW